MANPPIEEPPVITLEEGESILCCWVTQWLEDGDEELAFWKVIVVQLADGRIRGCLVVEYEDETKALIAEKVADTQDPMVQEMFDTVKEEFPEAEWRPAIVRETLSPTSWQSYEEFKDN